MNSSEMFQARIHPYAKRLSAASFLTLIGAWVAEQAGDQAYEYEEDINEDLTPPYDGDNIERITIVGQRPSDLETFGDIALEWLVPIFVVSFVLSNFTRAAYRRSRSHASVDGIFD